MTAFRVLLCDYYFTGIQRFCVLVDGSRIEVPVARVTVYTLYFIGSVKAWCLENPLFSSVIGKKPNAGDTKEYDRSWKPSQNNSVVTRQQSRKETKKPQPICLPKKINSDISQDEIEAKQNDEERRKSSIANHHE